MKTIVICASIASLLTAVANAQNENITWGTPTTISGDSDVNTQGTLFGSWAPYNGLAPLLVNGVDFDSYPTHTFPDGATDTFDNGGGNGTFATPTTPDANYNDLLNAGAFGNNSGSYTISWTGMTPGDDYLVELWVNDGRNSTTDARTETVTGGANTSDPLAYGIGDGIGQPGGGPGDYIIGTFVADSSGDETLTLTSASSAQFNLLQVRDLTVVPEPSTLALLAAGAGAMLFGFRRKNRAV